MYQVKTDEEIEKKIHKKTINLPHKNSKLLLMKILIIMKTTKMILTIKVIIIITIITIIITMIIIIVKITKKCRGR